MRTKKLKLNLMLPIVVGVGCYMAATGDISWAVFGLIMLSHCSLDVTWVKKG